MIFSFILLITLWVFGPQISMSATVAALIGLVILLLSSVLSWDDVIKEKGLEYSDVVCNPYYDGNLHQ